MGNRLRRLQAKPRNCRENQQDGECRSLQRTVLSIIPQRGRHRHGKGGDYGGIRLQKQDRADERSGDIRGALPAEFEELVDSTQRYGHENERRIQ